MVALVTDALFQLAGIVAVCGVLLIMLLHLPPKD